MDEIFAREIEIMVAHYKSKKKMGKKTLAKLMSIKPHHLEDALNRYFTICKLFYQRQMMIWVLLRHKYLRTSAVSIKERKWMFKELNQIKQESFIVSPFTETKNAAEEEIRAAAQEAQMLEQADAKPSFPFFFSEGESEPIFEITQKINDMLAALFKTTTESAVVGKLGDYLIEKHGPINSPRADKPKPAADNDDIPLEETKDEAD